MAKEIPLTQGKVAIVDDEDYEWLSQWKWCAMWHRNTFYAVHTYRDIDGRWKAALMHREAMGRPERLQVDHKNRNGLDNRKENLRLCNNVQNAQNRGIQANNTSGFKGVSFNKSSQKWSAKIRGLGKRIHLGNYMDKEDAARAYDAAARELHGEFAVMNFPDAAPQSAAPSSPLASGGETALAEK